MKQLLKKISTSLFVLALLTACNGKKNIHDASPKKLEIKSPIPQADIKFEEFEVDNSKEQIIKTKRGSTITIPAGSIVDKDAKAAGKVKLKYREFHDAVDILVSGIPMNYDAMGNSRNMQTAGMFEIRAEKAGEALSVAEGQKIDVKMASYETGTDYNFFQLDENGKGWQFIDYNSKIEANPEKEKLKKELAKKGPSLAFPLDDKYFVFDYWAILDIMFNDDYNVIMQNKDNPAVQSKIKKYGLMWLSSYCHDQINFKGVVLPASLFVWKKLSNNSFPAWLKDGKTDFCSLTAKGNNIYELNVEESNGKQIYKATIECIMPLNQLFKFSAEYWEKNYKDAMAKVEAEMERLKFEADVFRSMQISGFGIYNYDKLMGDDENIKVIANFDAEESLKKAQSNYTMEDVYYIPGDEKTLIKLPKSNWGKLNLVPTNKGRFISILPGQTLGIYAAEKYAQLNFEDLRKQDNPKLDFVLSKSEQKVASADDIRKILGFN